MVKKFVKSMFIVSILLLTAGLAFFLPNTLKKAEAEGATLLAQGNEEKVDGPVKLWNDGELIELTAPSTGTHYGHTGVYEIGSASDLAYVAYMVNGGDTNYQSAVYYQTANIDLEGKLWTPIGTYTNPFKGIYYGNGKTISNISITDASVDANTNSAAGLFGNTNGASLCDIVLAGTTVYNTAKSSASLVGSATGGEIINCYDKSSRIGQHGVAMSYAVGKTSNTYVFLGGAVNGGSAEYTNATAISNALPINSSSTGLKKGYVGFYKIETGDFMRKNSTWYESQLVRVLLADNATSPAVYSYSPINNLYQNAIPVLRESAGDNNIYPILQGSKASIPQASTLQVSKAFITTISYSSNQTISVYLNFGYGNGRSGQYSFQYDQTFSSYYTLNPYMKTRVGYVFEGLYNNTSFVEQNKMNVTGYDYKKSFPTGNSSYYYNWNAGSGKDVTFQFAIAKDEGGVFTTAEALRAAIKMSSTDTTGGNSISTDNIKSNQKVSGVTSGTEVKTTFTLNPGYVVKVLTNNETTVTMNETTKQADRDSGIYVNFLNTTGTGSDYTTTNKNNDSYNKATAVGSYDASTGKYTVSVNNIVGTGGYVYIVVGRIEYEIDITPTFVKEANEADIPYQWRIMNGTTQVSTIAGVARIDGDTLYVRRGEAPVLRITTKLNADSSAVVIAIASYSGMQTQPTEGTKSDPRFNYYQTWLINCGTVISNGNLTMRLGYCKSMITISSVDQNGKVFEDDNAMANGLSTQANGSSEYLNNSTGFLISMNATDSITVKNNGYYQVSAIKVNGTPLTGISHASDGTTSSWSGNVFTVIYDGSGVNYNVVVEYALRSFSLSYEYYFEGAKQTAISPLLSTTTKNGATILSSTSNLAPTSVLTITNTMTNLGKGVFFVPTLAVELAYLDKDGRAITPATGVAGYRESTITKGTSADGVFGYTLNLGTYNTVVKFYFEYRTVSFSVNKLQRLNSDNTTSELSSGLVAISPNLEFQYNFTAGTASLSSANLGGIQIHSQYYLLGWYLKNGQVAVTDVYASLCSNAQIIADVVAVGAQNATANTSTFTYNGVNAYVGQRVVNVKQATGTKGNGQFYLSDKTTVVDTYLRDAGSVLYSQELAVSNSVYYNLGHTFASWSVPLNSGSITNGKYSITGSNWYAVFRRANDGSVVSIDESGYQTWSGFSTQTKETRSVTLTATWNVIEYNVSVDGIASTTVKIGEVISYTTVRENKDGQATYTIGSHEVNGSVKNGYVVVGYDLAHNGGADTIEMRGAVVANGRYVLSASNFLAFINSDNRFEVNSTPISITTIREAGTYKIYLENSKNSYFSYTYDKTALENKGYGGVENGTIYIIVTFDSSAVNLKKALDEKLIVPNRTGYNYSGWVRSVQGEQTTTEFSLTAIYTDTRDIYIVPTWSLKTQTAQSGLAYSDDVGSLRKFYVTNAHDVMTGSLYGSNVTASDSVDKANLILTNGEKVTGYGYEVTFNGSTRTYANQTVLNISIFEVAGEVSVKFYITIQDIVNKKLTNTYTAYSSAATFEMVKNSIYIYNANLRSVYNGTSEFVAGESNDFGEFLYRYEWNGTDRASGEKTAVGATSAYFANFTIAGGVYTAGTNRTLRMGLNLNVFGTKDFTQIFDNVQKDSKEYYILNNSLTIEKAKIVIDFPDGSAYYVPGVIAIVYTNNTPSQFSVGSKTFTYSYSQITLLPNALPGVYTGSEEHTTDAGKFIVKGLTVEGYSDEEREANFEWVISKESTFKLLDSSSALKYQYFTKYLTAENGVLNQTLAGVYGGQADTLSVTDISVNGSSVEISSQSQFTIYHENDVVLFVAGNGTMEMYVYINSSLLSSISLKFTVSINLSSSRSEVLFPLAFGTNDNGTSYSDEFDSTEGTLFSEETLSYGQSGKTIYAILTDAVKVNLAYNGGKRESGTGDTIYVSAVSGGVQLDAPTYPYAGISFGGFTAPTLEGLSVATSGGKVTFATTRGGKTQSLTAKWNFKEIIASVPNNTLERYASENGIALGVSEVVAITSPEIFANKTYSLSSNGTNYAFNATTSKFEVKNADGFATTDMSGSYTIVLNFTFSDGVQAPQSQTKSFTFTLNILPNTIEVAYNGGELVFNNTNQAETIAIDFTLNGEDNGSEVISSLATTDTTSAKKNVYISGLPNLTLRNAGTYTITFNVVSKYTGLYSFADGTDTTSLTLIIKQYKIVLAEYEEQINLAKVFGQADANPLKATIVIAENADDAVALAFTREEGEGVGNYPLTFKEIIEAEDKINYVVETTGFDTDYQIIVPSGNLKVELLSAFNYTYNGFALGGYTVSYNGTNYTLSASAGSENLAITFDMYYMNGSAKIQIPVSQREVYAGFVEFTSNADKNAGSYTLNVRLTSAGSDWAGVDMVNTQNAIISVAKRLLTVSAVEKVFDQTANFRYNNKNSVGNTATLTLENVVTYSDGSFDEIEITGSLAKDSVGMAKVVSMTITNTSNYTLADFASLNAKIVADDSTIITATPTESTQFDYGVFTNSLTTGEISSLVPLAFNGGEIGGAYLTISNATLAGSVYSTGGYAVVGSHTITFTISSTNFTFGGERVDDLSHIYTMTAETTITINPIAVTIINSSLKITKPYDGNANVLSKFVGQAVNANGGYYTSSQILAGDIITVIGGAYENPLIGNDKPITLTFAEGDDSANYIITTDVVGDITKITLIYNKKGDTQTFVDGSKEFGNSAPIKLEYLGDFDAIIDALLNEDTFLTRIGYTQTGWRYNGVSLAQIDESQKAQMLQDGVDAGSVGITIEAIWQISTFIVKIETNDRATASVTEIAVEYYSNLKDISITANIGYTFEGAIANNQNAVLTVGTTGNREGEIDLETIVGDITITIVTEEIEVKIIIDYNPPMDLEVLTDDPSWGNARERVMKYTQLIASDLPVLKVSKEDTFDFSHWTLNGITSGGGNIWTRINGALLTADNLDGYEFVAHWTEAELELVINYEDTATVAVYDDEGHPLTATDGVYILHYLDTFVVDITHNDWYKWTAVTIDGDFNSITGDTIATNANSGNFTVIEIGSHMTINIVSEAIKVVFATSYVCPASTTIAQVSGSVTGVYTADAGMETMADVLGEYLPKAGTFKQESWQYGAMKVEFTASAQNVITTIYGRVPTTDISIDLTANFVGLEYLVTFEKGTAPQAEFVGDDAGKVTTTRRYTYGSAITEMPILDNEGKDYIWISGANEIFSVGKNFVTSLANADCTLTLTAEWENIPYKLYITIDENADKVTDMKADGVAVEEYIQVILGATQEVYFTMVTGYELDPINTTITAGSGETSLAFTANVLTIANIKADTYVSVAVKAKDYIISINQTGFETLSNATYNVSYMQNISSIFDGQSFSRVGYTISALTYKGANFATFNGSEWTFNGYYVQSGAYVYDGGLELDIVWTRDEGSNQFTLSVDDVENVYYNGTEQTIAYSSIAINGGETFAVGNTFANGERAKEVYFLLNGGKYPAENDFSFAYKNAIAGGKLVLVAVIEDVIGGGSYSLTSQEIEVSIYQTDVAIKNANVYSYYTGSENVELISGASFGELFFHDKVTPMTELEIAKVEIIDQTGKYWVSTVAGNYEVKYYFNTATGFNSDNYTGIVKEGGFYTLTTSGMTDKVYAQITQANATIQLSGRGYANGNVHRVHDAEVKFPEYVTGANATINSIHTASAVAGRYSLISDFTLDVDITNGNGEDIKFNFTFSISGDYSIVSTAYAYEIVAKAKDFAITEVADADEILSLSSIEYDGTKINLGSDDVDYSVRGELIFSISGNGTDNLKILVTKEKVVSLSFNLAGETPVLAWTNTTEVSSLLALLQNLESEGVHTYNATYSTGANLYAVMTEYKAVLQSLGDKGGDMGYKYIARGTTITLDTPITWTGFEFAEWVVEEELSLNGNEITLDANGTITATTARVIWEIATPTADVQDFLATALFDGGKIEISLDDIMAGGITNANQGELTYSYEFLKGTTSLSKSQSFEVAGLISSSGQYTLKVTASKAGYVANSANFMFNVSIGGIVLNEVIIENHTFTYSNKDFAGDILITLNGVLQEAVSLAELTIEASPYCYFEVDKGIVKNAGTYNLTLVLNSDVFNIASMGEFEYNYQITVEKASILLKQSDIPAEHSEKLLGMEDPTFTFNLTMFEGDNAEEVEVSLTRQSGENKGEYQFTSISVASSNFTADMEEGLIFTIKQAEGALKVVLENEISAVYSKTTPVIEIAYNAEFGQWIMSLGETSTNLILLYQSGEDFIEISGTLYQIALENISFSLDEAVDAGTYDAGNMQYVGEGNFTDFIVVGSVKISTRAITPTGITKVFDRNENIISTTDNLNGLIDGDDVALTGKYKTMTVANGIELTSLALVGERAFNYHVVADGATGNITPLAVSEVLVSVANAEFEYGQISNSSPSSELASLVGEISLSLDGNLGDLSLDFVSVESLAIDGGLSSAGYLNAGSQKVVIKLSSINFTGLNSDGYAVTISVTQKVLDLSAMAIVKDYDKTATLPNDIAGVFASYIFAGDDVQIDMTASHYESADIGTNKAIVIVLAGDDSANYVVLDNVMGTINAYSVKLQVNATTQHADLVTDGAFVADGIMPNIGSAQFKVGYPSTESASAVMASLVLPTRTGYTATGWKYYNGTGYTPLTSENLFDFLESIVNDESLTEKTATIYTAWEIEYYSISISGENIASYQISSDNPTTFDANENIKYFSDISINFTANRGYKFKAYMLASGNVGGRDFADVGNNTSVVSLNQIASNLALEVSTEEIMVTFAIEANVPNYTTRTDTTDLEKTFAYSLLASMTEDDIASLSVTEGTYYLVGLLYNGSDTIGENTLQEIVDLLDTTLATDTTINLLAKWAGEEYVITFDPNGGTLVGESQIQAVYGSVFNAVFPEAIKDGYVKVWTDLNGKTYTELDALTTIGTLDEDGKYHLTFTAEWRNADFNLTIAFEEKLSVKVNDEAIISGQVFTLTYGSEGVMVEISCDAGYSFSVDNSRLVGEMSQDGNIFNVKNLTADSVIKFGKVCLDNTLTLTLAQIDSISVTIDGQEVEGSDVIVVKTESVAEIVLTAVKGYEFALANIAFTGSGTLEREISVDKGTLILTWSGFTADGEAEITAIPSTNTITIEDASEFFMTLTFNGQAIAVTGGTFAIKTDEEVAVAGTLKYGYENANISTGEVDYVKAGSVANTFNNGDKYFYFTATLENINDSFSVTLWATERAYTFEVYVKDGMQAFGEITSETPTTVKFGETLEIAQQELRYDYMFNGWESDGEIISTEAVASILLDESQKALLESVAHGDNITIYATYIKRTIDVTFSASEYGGYTLIQEGEEFAYIGAGKTIVQEIILGIDLVIALAPDKGYEVDLIKLDGVAIALGEYGYTEADKMVTISTDIDNPFTTVEVSFKASALDITVLAGTRIRYEEHLGTDAGGWIYATNSRGERLDDGVYKENDGNLIIGANYKFGTYTDIKIYFVAVAKSGFSYTISCDTPGVIINESNINGTKVYSFSGIKENITIKAIFIAKENSVNIQFAMQGKTDIAYAGTIAVDSSSALVSASPNRGSHLEIGVVTSATLSLEVYSSLAYSLLADENGYLVYSISYKGDVFFETVTVGMITAMDRVTTGFSYGTTLEIPNINADATIYIYVVPQEYTLTFAVSDIESVTMTTKVRYGEAFDLSSLTEEELGIVFPERAGFTFSGYYTKPLGQGTMYINGKHEIVSVWLEDGFEFDGTIYVKDDGFDMETNSFILYAGWIFNKAVVNVEFTPVDVQNVDESKTIADMIANYHNITAWTSQYSRWYAEILIGTNVEFKAINFNGYEFESWTLYFEDETEGVEKASSFTLMDIKFGTYTLKAVYNPTYTMQIQNLNNGKDDGGDSYLQQNGVRVKGKSFDKDEILTLKAIPNEGYKFLYWINIATNERYEPTYGDNGEATYTFAYPRVQPLNLKAVFVGKTVVVNLNTENGGQYHSIREVTVNGKTIDYLAPFNACVGDEIKLYTRKAIGFGFEFVGANFAEEFNDTTNYYIFSYTLAVADLQPFGADSYLINIAFNAVREKLNLSFMTAVDMAEDDAEIGKAGGLRFKDAGGKVYDVVAGRNYQITFGDTVHLLIDTETNYRIAYILVKCSATYDATAWLIDGNLVIDQDFVSEYYARNIEVIVYFQRLVWIMDEFRADTFAGGSGTEADPYQIATPAQFAYVAYLVNNGMEKNGIKYADAHYILTADIDFRGRYWEPVGTEENPFNGTFNLGEYDIKGVTHYKTYSNPKTSYSGLFWHLGENAKIIQINNSALIAGIVGGILLLLLLILLIIYIVRRQAKRKRQEIANG